MNRVAQLLLICFLLINPLNTTLFISSEKQDGAAAAAINLQQKSANISSISKEIIIRFNETTNYRLQPGKLLLPAYIAHWTFPFGTKITSIQIIPKNLFFKQNTENTPYTPLPHTTMNQNTTCLVPTQKETSNANKILFPNEWYDIRMGTGINGDEQVLFVNIAFYPLLILNPLHLFMYTTKALVTIQYEEPHKHVTPNTTNNTYNMLIITIDRFKETLQPFLDYKKNTTTIHVATLEQIPHLGRDKQEDIKLFIKQSIEQWGITHVLFVGGYNEIPVRNVHVQEIRSILMDDSTFISDLYYADIYDADGKFCTWDTNNNNIFGEFNLNDITPTDHVDLYPDVYFGRLACRTEEEVTTCITKIQTYETTTPNSDWFSTAIAIGADTFTEDALGISEGERITESIASILNGFTIKKLWGGNGKLMYAQNISTAIEQGAGFVFFEGHAGSNSYRTHPYRSSSEWIPVEWYRTYHINDLSNIGTYPIVTINACNTCKFSVNHTSFGWSFVINPHGGSIATMGMTCLSWIYPGIFCTYGLGGRIHQNVYNAYTNGATTFGELWANAIIEYLNMSPWSLSTYDHRTLKGWQPLGDPSLILPEYQMIHS